MLPGPTFRSSGDLLADRRYEYARAAFEEDDFSAAVELASQAIELTPDFAAAHALLGRAAAMLGQTAEAIAAFERALALEPDDALGAGIGLAQLGVRSPDRAIAAPYLRALFDDYALRFDRHLTKTLHYRGPALIADALRRAALKRFRPTHFGHCLDLGCGTGLMGRALADRVGRLEGVDLSSRMLAQAAKTRVYAGLHEGDLVAFLASRAEGEADLVTAADVFVYIADLRDVLRASQRVLRREGFLAFTVQAHAGDGVALGEDGRFAHGEPYLRRTAEQTGFTTIVFESVSTRHDRGEPVPGFLVVAER